MRPSVVPWLGRLLIALAACLAALATHYAAPPSLAVFDERLRDGLLRMAAQTTPETRLTIIDIDEASLAALGPWPWPRSRLADLIEILLGTLAARGVALDMVLPEVADDVGDARLVALAEHAPLTLAIALDFVPRHPPLRQGVAGNGLPRATDVAEVVATGFIGNHMALAGARCIGNIGFIPDADGALRKLPLFGRLDDRVFLPLAAAMMSCVGLPLPQLADLSDARGFWRLAYRRDWSAFTVIPAHQVLEGSAPPELIADRLVLIGSSALGLGDRVATPLAAATSGVLVHAASLSELLDGARPVKANAVGWLATWTVLGTLLWLILVGRLAPWGNVVLVVSFTFGWWLLAYTAIDLQLPLLPVFAAGTLLLIGGLAFEWWLSRQESLRVRRLLAHYVAPSVLDELLRQPGERPLAPRYRDITVLNADMVGYTRATETLGLEGAARLTRDFLAALTAPVLTERGTLDKYTGDGLVAFWNAPLSCPDHAERALRAAQGILSAVARLNGERAKQGLPAVRVRIGIESGEALVGDLGTDFRSTYTAVGRCINIAAKLQELAKTLSVAVVIGPMARQRLRDAALVPLGLHPLDGLATTVELFTLPLAEVGEKGGPALAHPETRGR